MLNALNYRPAEDVSSHLVNICGQHQASGDDSDDDSVIEILSDNSIEADQGTRSAALQRGLFFLADVNSQKETWRMASTPRRIPIDKLAFCYKRPNIHTLRLDFGIQGIIHEPQANEERVNNMSQRIHNRRLRTLAVESVQSQEIVPPPVDFALIDAGVQIQDAADDSGEDSLNEEGTSDPDRLMIHIWNQLAHDILAVSPNKKNRDDPSYLVMPVEQRSNITWDRYKTLDLSQIFAAIQAQTVDSHTWNRILFDRYFPPKGTPSRPRGTLQNFPYTLYYQQWFDLMGRLSEVDARSVRAAVAVEFRKVLWIPFAQSDRMWATKQATTRGWEIFPVSHKGPCPQIAINLEVYAQTDGLIWMRAPTLAEDDLILMEDNVEEL